MIRITYIPISISVVMENSILGTNSMVKTIKISEDIHTRLLKVGSMGETFEDVIERLLDFYESKGKSQK